MLVDHLLNIYKECEKFRKTSCLKYLYRNELDKTCFGHDAAYSYSTNVPKGNILDKI